MSTIFEDVDDALATLTPIPYGMGTYISAGEDLPDTYLVYQLISGAGQLHADDVEKERTYRIQVSIFSRSGLASLPNVDAAMLAQGFTIGPERELPWDPISGHYGLAKDYFKQKERTL